MAENWDNPYVKEQVWVSKDILESLNGQLSSYNRVGEANGELSVDLPLEVQQEDVPRSTDPNVLIQEKLQSLKTAILDKVNLFLQHRLVYTLDFSNSLISENAPVRDINLFPDELLGDLLKLNAIATNSMNLGLPVALNKYSYINVFVVVLLKYLNDIEYVRRVGTKEMVPLPQYRQNKYDNLRYKFHRYKMQFMLATKHQAMIMYNDLRWIGWGLMNKKFEEINEISGKFITEFNLLNSDNRITITEKETRLSKLYHDCQSNLKGQLLNFLLIFGIRNIPVQSHSRDTTRLVPEEIPSTWMDMAPGASAAQAELEDSYLEDPEDEVSQYVPGDIPPQSPGAHSIASSSDDSELGEPIERSYDFLYDPLNHAWMDEPPTKYPRRGN